jgi:hypothetical protein
VPQPAPAFNVVEVFLTQKGRRLLRAHADGDRLR